MKSRKKSSAFDPVQLCLLGVILLTGLILALLAGRDTGTKAPADPAPPVSTAFPAPEGLRIAVASDLHLDPFNTDHSSGAQTSYSGELVDALLWDARQQGAALLLLTGDLVNGGKPQRHAALTEKLRRAEAEGLAIYVLPGNHDLAPVGQREFAEFYGEFGYEEAYSRDEASLSYCILRDELMLLMMDTAGYSIAARDLPEAPAAKSEEAFLTEETLRWAETMLKEAQKRELPVLCAGHYNLLPESSRQHGSGFYLENSGRFAQLLRRYRAPLYLSGHMHLRAVYQEQGLTELLTEYLLAYPAGYSMLDLTEHHLRYTPRRIDVDAWAAQSGQRDPALLQFAQWQQEGLRRYSESNVAYMAQKNPLSRQQARQAAEFFYAVMSAYWDGSLREQRTALEAMPGCEPFFRCAEGFSYGWWLRDLMENASPQLGGFTLEW